MYIEYQRINTKVRYPFLNKKTIWKPGRLWQESEGFTLILWIHQMMVVLEAKVVPK